MTLLIKDANTAIQPISTQLDAAANLVPMHVPASVPATGGVATPVSTAAPLPVINTAGSVAVDGSIALVATTLTTLFSSIIPTNGYMIGNNTGATVFVLDGGNAGASTGFPVATATVFVTPTGYKPIGAVTAYGANSGNLAARRW